MNGEPSQNKHQVNTSQTVLFRGLIASAAGLALASAPRK